VRMEMRTEPETMTFNTAEQKTLPLSMEQESSARRHRDDGSSADVLTPVNEAPNKVRFSTQPVTGSETQETIVMVENAAVDVKSTNDSTKRGVGSSSTSDAKSSTQHTTNPTGFILLGMLTNSTVMSVNIESIAA